MDYRTQMTGNRPGLIIIFVDTSGSMASIHIGGLTKVVSAGNSINRAVLELLVLNLKEEGIQNKCKVVVIEYGNNNRVVMEKDLAQLANESDQLPTTSVDSDGGRIEIPNYVSGLQAGGGTPMAQAFETAYSIIENFCQNNPDHFPPICINITDGAPNNSVATAKAMEKSKSLGTNYGKTLLFNFHISSNSSGEVVFPKDRNELSDSTGKFLYDTASVIPAPMLEVAVKKGLLAKENSKLMVSNASPKTLTEVLLFGSTVAAGGETAPDTFSYS